MLTLTIVFALLMVLPVKWAADFTNGGNTGVVGCLLASFIAPVLAIMAFRASSGGFEGFLLAYLALVATYAAILRIPARSIVGFAVMVFALQIAVGFALYSLGFNAFSLLRG